ncbi:L-lactate dehydrogenase [Candidatus Rhodobacter oscarellae]|uniref:L-lactate dehydrogenase n=1 Tax=Candidatus Rhodobacter oscarellae TaxID=1675527 RepID=A0A0J9GX37_9RHOB|nr:alpha-hydroxy acid oxidase [Candidatus Rhodobacter lobularis]KMW58088.1 L-lactate dehydrogenase [Candidatus Rhodobacter lobularis]
MSLDNRYPAISDLAARARRRIPGFAWDYLDSGTGTEATVRRNRAKLDEILFDPAILSGELEFDLSTTLLGRDYPLPFGIAPVGMSGLMWPDAERTLARLGRDEGIPYSLSTVAAQTPETVGPHLGPDAWFQLYPPRDPDIRKDMLRRFKDAGFGTLVLTADVPVASRRERQLRGGMSTPPKLTPRILAQIALRPEWAMGTLRHGLPRLRTIESYTGDKGALSSTKHIGYLIRTSPDWEYLKWLRDHWDGPMMVKGVLVAEDAARLKDEGVDAVWVSNHAGRQFDGSPASIEVLPGIREAVGPDYPLVFDGGIAGGLDIMRALAMGADFVMLGRAFHYGLGALGAAGAAHVVHILREDLKSNLGQLGLASFEGLAERMRSS